MQQNEINRCMRMKKVCLQMSPAKFETRPESMKTPDLSFLSPDDPIRKFIGLAKDGPSTDEWLAITRGDRDEHTPLNQDPLISGNKPESYIAKNFK